VEIVSHIYRFERGCYSMADDQMAADAKNNGFCLDLMLFFGRRPEWPSQFGGFSSFFAIGENEEVNKLYLNKNINFLKDNACESNNEHGSYCVSVNFFNF
jgi:hypothetical protein